MQKRRRLNLFAFSPESNALFGMLILASLMLALFLGWAFGLFFGITDSVSSIDITTRGLEVTRTYLPVICFSATAALAVLGAAFIFYLRHPLQIRRHRKIVPISEKDQEIQEHVNKLALPADIGPPRIEMPVQGLRGTDAQAFGVGKTQIIGLDGGFRILRKTQPDVFNALLHHELAHFANEDVGRSYFSDALWKSIRWVIILPFVLGLLGNIVIGLFLGVRYDDLLQRFFGPAQVIFKLLVQFSFILVVAGVIWARLLRTREFYADWRAVLWGSQSGLNKIFHEQTEMEKPKTLFKLLKLHPDAKERMDAIEHPETLFNLSLMIVFLAGLLLAFMFVGLYFALSTFLAFAGVFQSIRDSSTGLLYWFARGILWFGIASLFLIVIGLSGWLISGVLLPQIQKQTILELINKQHRWTQSIKMLITALILVAGIEIGFSMSPFGQFAPSDLWEFVLEFFIIAPILVLTAWWYLIYIRFISLRLSATQIGRNFSVWRSWFMKTASVVWAFLFFIPGLFLSRYLSGELLEVFLYFSLIWLACTLLLSVVAFGATWAAIKLFFDRQPKECPECGKVTHHAIPAIGLCEHCGHVLGEWLFIPEKVQID
jgi:Zn-dependent protease with chaperone function